jgi:hypothetical protein
MAKHETIGIVQTNLREHPAVQAWCALRSVQSEPARIEILKGRLAKGTQRTRKLVCRLVGVGPAGSSVIGKRSRRHKAVIESMIYNEILPNLPIPSLNYYGMMEEANGEFCWLFLEDAGDESYSAHVAEHRALSAQWLGLMHTSAAHGAAPAFLPDKGPEHYLKRLQSARDDILHHLGNHTFQADDLAPLEAIVSHCDVLESNWDEVGALCGRLPRTLVHGDFVPKNLRVLSNQAGMVLLPFDWGEAGWGVPATDIMQVEIDAYWLVVRDHWSGLGFQAIYSSAIVGRIFRCLDAIYWELVGFRHKGTSRIISCMRIYESSLTDAIRMIRVED